MPLALDGPLFVTVTVTVKVEPGGVVGGALTETARSAFWPITVVTLLLLFAPRDRRSARRLWRCS